MSEVTNLIFTFSVSEDEESRINDVNSYEFGGCKINLISADYNKNITQGFSWYGGTKFLEAPLYIGAFNNLNLEHFINYLKGISWDEPEYVQIIVKQPGDDKFRIFELEKKKNA